MIIKFEDSIYHLPESENIILLSESIHSENMLHCLYQYFEKKKKTYCRIYDNDNTLLSVDDVAFIYFPYGSSVNNEMQMKTKSNMNTELAQFIEMNPDWFYSVERIRNNLFELLTDKGTYEIERILSKGLMHHVDFRVEDFNVFQLLQMLNISFEEYSESEKYMIVYNLLMHVNRKKPKIIYIDVPIDLTVIRWASIQTADLNNIIILNNESIQSDALNNLNKCAVLHLSNFDYVETIDFDIFELPQVSYLLNSFIRQNIMYQKEKNIDFLRQFQDETSTFFLRFSDTTHPDSL